MAKIALITGISGQDGSFLSELLLSKGYEVHGIVRRTSQHVYPNIAHIQDKLVLHYGDMENEHHLCSVVNDVHPDEVYNLAAQSDVGVSFQTPEYTGDTTGLGAVRLLEAVREFAPKARYYQASTSELFGDCPPPQNELSPMIPASPYAAAKLYAHNMTRIYRKAYGLFACCGILMNHESTRRGPNFVTRKITLAIARISYHQQGILELGNMQARRDWGHARDYVRAMWMMLQRERPDDFVIGTGETHTVQEFVEATFNAAGLDWKKYVVVNPKFYRPLDVNYLQADITKARTVLGWSPVITFEDLVHIMVRHDLDMLSPNKMQEMEVQS